VTARVRVTVRVRVRVGEDAVEHGAPTLGRAWVGGRDRDRVRVRVGVGAKARARARARVRVSSGAPWRNSSCANLEMSSTCCACGSASTARCSVLRPSSCAPSEG
jgi:hypothetical protein